MAIVLLVIMMEWLQHAKVSTIFVCVSKGSNFAAITCSPVADPINGTVFYSVAADDVGNYAFNVTANHSCYTGFSLVGDNKRICTGDGSRITGAFDGVAPTCERKCMLNNLYKEK